MACCSPRPYGKVFSDRTARRDARRIRRRGLNRTEREAVEALRGRVETVLDVGGGVGAIGIELLRGGASGATTLELSPSYEREALALAQERGVSERYAFRIADVAVEDVEPADGVVMHRVVCCYPDGELLVRRGARYARRLLVVVYPRETPWVRAGFALLNAAMWAVRLRFRSHVHPVDRLLAAADGMRLASRHAGLVWETAVFER